MRNLLAADFYRYRKDILTKVALILIVVFACFTCGLYFVLDKLTAGEDIEMVENILCGRYLYGATFSIGSDMGLIIPIFAGAIVCKDFSMGTIRNKIIRGYGRDQIFLSHFLTSISFGSIMFLLYAFVNLSFGSLLLGYAPGAIDGEEILFLFVSAFSGIVIYSSMAALVTMIATITGSMGLSIVFYIAFTLGVSLLQGIVSLIPNVPELITNLMTYLPGNLAYAVAEGSKEWADYGKSVLVSVILLLAFGIVGMTLFRKKDQK